MSKSSNTARRALAIEGGTPIRSSWLPYGRQTIDDSDVQAVVEALRSDWLTQGPAIAEFETLLAAECGVDYAVAVCNGTAALHAAYFAVGIKPGDEVIVPAITFAATSNAALYLGATPIFVDIDPANGNVAVKGIRRAITGKTRAIVGVDFAGHPCDIVELRGLADELNVPLVIDGAHSLGATYKGEPPASLADLTTYSFHPVKSITTAEGGAIVTNNKFYADRMRMFRTHGIEKDKSKLVNSDQGPWYHEMQELGYNYRITDLQAALGKSQIQRLHRFIERRREIASEYRRQFADLKCFAYLNEKPHVQSAYHLFPLLVTKSPFAETRKFTVEALHAENIGAQVHYIPVYQHPYYRERVCNTPPNCPQAESFYERIINLPIFPTMTERDVRDVVEVVINIDNRLATTSA